MGVVRTYCTNPCVRKTHFLSQQNNSKNIQELAKGRCYLKNSLKPLKQLEPHLVLFRGEMESEEDADSNYGETITFEFCIIYLGEVTQMKNSP